MIKKLALFLLIATLVCTPVFGSSENSVDRNLAVKDDFSFEPGTSHVSLHIQELHPNEFGTNPTSFRLKLSNAQWFETGNPAGSDPAAMAADSTMTTSASITIVRLGDEQLEITLNRSGSSLSEKAWWKIPIYAEVTDAGIVSVEVDGRDGLVSSGVYEIAQAHGGDYLNRGYSFTPENPQWMTIREPSENAYAGTQKFQLVLENGTWFSDNDSRLGPQAMLKAAAVSGIEAGSISEMRRIDDKTLELTILRGAGSSIKAKGVWSFPLYFTVDKFGLAKVSVVSLDSPVSTGVLGTTKVTDPVRYIRTVTLTLNQPGIVMKQGSDEQSTTLDVSPVNPSGSTLIPVRGVFEQLGAAVQWNGSDRTVTLVTTDKRIILSADSASASLNGTAFTLLQKPQIINGRLLIPLRSLSEQLGFGVEWVEAAQQIIIRQD